MSNRALEFLNEAYGLLAYPISNSDRARLLVRLAIAEVEELLDRHADGDGRGVLIVEAQRKTPAFFAARPRAALRGNGKGL